MKEPISEELLSAYVDGELSADERATIEHWLAQSPEARAKVDDFRRLSAVFAELPRTEVPQEFPVKVLQLAERRMLLPEEEAVSPRRILRRWGVAIGVMAATAVGLLLILQATNRDPNLPVQAFAVHKIANAPAPAPGNEIASADLGDSLDKEGQLVAQSERHRSDETDGTKAAAPAAPPAALVTSRKSIDASRGSVAGPRGADTSGAAADSARPIVADKSKGVAAPNAARAPGGLSKATLRDESSANPQLAKIKQAIESVSDSDTNGEMVSVMKFYGVDQAYGMKLIQSYLSENGVPDGAENPAVAKGGSDSADRAEAAKRKVANRGEALFVEADTDQFLKTFAKVLAADVAGMRVEMEAPIELAALDSVSQDRLKRAPAAGAPRLGELGRGVRESASAPVAGAAASDGGAKSSADASPLRAKKTSPDNKPAAEAVDRKADKQSGEKRNTTEKTPVSNPDGATAEQKSRSLQSENGANLARRAANGTANAQASQRARQVVMPVPPAIDQRTQFGSANNAPAIAPTDAPTDGKGEGANFKAARRATARPAPQNANDNDASPTDKEQVQGARVVVRVLILFELEPGKPGAPAAAPAEKGPPGGA